MTIRLTIGGRVFHALWEHRPDDWDADTYRAMDELRRNSKPGGFGGLVHSADVPEHVAAVLGRDMLKLAGETADPQLRAKLARSASSIGRKVSL